MTTLNLEQAYDYIVIGGGTAGLVIASRLTEDTKVQVLVIESGPDHLNDPLVSTPGLLAALYGNETYDWNFKSAPQAALEGRRISLGRGKGLGGSSAVNFMTTVFPSRGSIDAWGKLGNSGWFYDDLSPYFKKFGTRHEPTEEVRNVARINHLETGLSGDGPVHLSYGEGYGPMNTAWIDAHAALGLSATESDPMSGQVLGAFQNVAAIDPNTKTRSYSATAYYDAEVRKRDNLTVLTNSLTQKIELEGRDPHVIATGVTFKTKDGSIKTIKARREVILSAGAFHSPQILELSGLGSEDILKKYGIPVVINNPAIGENLQDHPMVCQSYQVKDGIPSLDLFRDPSVVQAAMAQYEANSGGPLGMATSSASYLPLVDGDGRVSAEAKQILLDRYVQDNSERSVQLKELITDPSEPALYYVFFASQMHTESTDPSHFGTYITPLRQENYVTILNALSHPFSRGSCHIQSPDVNTAPIVDPALISHPADLEMMASSVMFAEKLTSVEPLRSAVFVEDGARLPSIVPDSMERAKELIRLRTVSNMHPSGTCAMLPRQQGGVVDERLLVHGTKNLRVVDASIFPLIPVGNIQSTVYAVAEKAADLIKGQ